MKKYKKKYIIFTESYNENVGGYVVLHKLCDLINNNGGRAFLYPAFNTHFFTRRSALYQFLRFFKETFRRFRSFRVNSEWDTPVLKKIKNIDDDWVVVYPETISGNPLGAKNVVRWFLHHPGFHKKEYYFGVGELYFKYHSGIKIHDVLKFSTSKLILKIVHYPNVYTSQIGMNKNKESMNKVCYALRKGLEKKLVHDQSGSILIDGKSHHEVANIFHKSSLFISYDPYTAYSTFAVLCGCDSVVIPDEGVDVDEWIPDSKHRAGIAYGFDDIDNARLKRNLLLERVANEIHDNNEIVKRFMTEVSRFFIN